MKILHVCLAAFYIDNFGYQENILPKIHKLQGHQVEILASTETYIKNKLSYVEPSSYINENGIPVKRIPYISYLPKKLSKKLRIYKGTYEHLLEFSPDVVFLHDIQFLSIKEIVRYAKENPSTKIFADGHTDFGNSARNWISKNILHKVIYKQCANKIYPYTSKFWGVTPLRVNFFTEVYGIPKHKVDLLVMGVDDSEIDYTKKNETRNRLRENLGLKNKFVIISGGKIDARKQIEKLLEAFVDISAMDIHLILFGSITDEMTYKMEKFISNEKISFLGWISPREASEYFFASDLAVFPGTHSVLWEQAVGCGLPAIFKKWEGMEHVDIGGNCLFIENSDKIEIENKLKKIITDKNLYKSMRKISEDLGPKTFSYTQIAKKAVELID